MNDHSSVPSYLEGHRLCTRCVLGDNIPGISLDSEGVCSVCRDFELNRDRYTAFFRPPVELPLPAVDHSGPDYDCLLLYSGGKDSTYVLLNLVERGLRVMTLTFDNGFLSPLSFENIRSVCSTLGVKNELVTLDAGRMQSAFRESLRLTGSVCYGCGRAFTARGTEYAIERGIPAVVTGLSRGQIFELKLEGLLGSGIETADADRYLMEIKKYYHADHPEIGRLVEDRVLETPGALEKLLFIDYFRYDPVTKEGITGYLAHHAPYWQRPTDAGVCSSNCRLNDAGILAHIRAHGYHNYAVPNSWEVRFGHISRAEALEEIGIKHMDLAETEAILRELGHPGSPEPRAGDAFLKDALEIDEDF